MTLYENTDLELFEKRHEFAMSAKEAENAIRKIDTELIQRRWIKQCHPEVAATSNARRI